LSKARKISETQTALSLCCQILKLFQRLEIFTCVYYYSATFLVDIKVIIDEIDTW